MRSKLITSSSFVYLLQRPRPASTIDSLARSRVVGRPAGQTARQRGRRPTGRPEVAMRAPMSQNVIKTVSFLKQCTVKKVNIFPFPAGMSLTKFSLAGNNLIIPDQGECGK